jgi:hypothetical protein
LDLRYYSISAFADAPPLGECTGIRFDTDTRLYDCQCRCCCFYGRRPCA